MVKAILCLSVGMLFGVTLMCCLFAARDADDKSEAAYRQSVANRDDG